MIKPIVALAAAANGVGPERTFTCTGELNIGGRVRHCTGQHGAVNMSRAIAKSCNIYFYELGRKIGAEPISALAGDLGFGRLTGIDCPYEWRGRLPDPSHTPGWGVGDTVNLSIGQGNLSVTPLQVTVMLGAVATGGKVIRPTILKRIEPPPDPEEFSPLPLVMAEVALSPAGLRAVGDGMHEAVVAGTASSLVRELEALHAAVKTGTAQTTDARINQAWIGGFLPRESPKYAFVAVIHNAPGHGADVAGPIAVAVLNTLQSR